VEAIRQVLHTEILNKERMIESEINCQSATAKLADSRSYNQPFVSLFNEDCRESMKRIPDGSVDLLLQDTPFGCTQNEWDIKPNFAEIWPEWERIAKPNAAMIFFGTQPFASELILSRAGLFRYDLIWYKALGTGFLNANKMPMRNHEHILVFYRNLPVYNPLMRVGKMRDKGNKGGDTTSNYGKFKPSVNTNDLYFPQSVVDFTNGDKTKEADHPTQKPLDLIRYLLLTYSNKGDTVFDGYSGSGTTAHACLKEGRKFIGSELDETYFKKSVQRLQNVHGELF
jgi:site-specific DNA-methyltransferase (adenine-specific)